MTCCKCEKENGITGDEVHEAIRSCEKLLQIWRMNHLPGDCNEPGVLVTLSLLRKLLVLRPELQNKEEE